MIYWQTFTQNQTALFMNDESIKILKSINLEYISLLQTFNAHKDNDEAIKLIVDEIDLFWKRKRKEVSFIINFLNEKEEIVFYTGSTNLSVKEKEHLPLMLCGDICLYDDPVPTFLTILNSNNLNDKIRKLFFEKTKIAIMDNIELLNQYQDRIIVLPLRSITSSYDIKDTTNQLLLSMFKDIDTIETFYKTVVSEDAFEKHINKDIAKYIRFSDSDSDALIDNINNFCSSLNIPFSNFQDKIHMAYFSALSQVLSIMYTAYYLHATPFIRSTWIAKNYAFISTSLSPFLKTIGEKESIVLARKVLYYNAIYNKMLYLDNLRTIETKIINKEIELFSMFIKDKIDKLDICFVDEYIDMIFK